MNRRVIVFFAALAVSALLGACGTQSKQATVVEMQEEVSESSTAEEQTESPEPDEEENDIEEEGRDGKNLDYFLLDRGVSLTIVTSGGKRLGNYKWENINGILERSGYQTEDVFPEFVADGVLYVLVFDRDACDYAAVAIDLRTEEVHLLCSPEDALGVPICDYYDGKIYRELGDGRITYIEKTPGKFEFGEEQITLEKFGETVKEYQWFMSSVNVQWDWSCSVRRCLDENGFVIGKSREDDSIVKIYEDGTIETIGKYPGVFVNAFDKDAVVYWNEDFETLSERLYCIDPDTGEVTEVSEGMNNFFHLCYGNGMVYYFLRDTDFLYTKNTIFCYDVKKKTHRKLYEAETVPGSTIMPGTEGFRLIGKDIYFTNVVDDKEKWVKFDPSEQEISFQDTGVTVQELSALKFGKVDYVENVSRCESCGIPLKEEYLEIFQMDPKYSAFEDRINRMLAGNKEQSKLDSILAERGTKEGSCKEHLESPYLYVNSFSQKVSDVQLLRERYLAVTFENYFSGAVTFCNMEQMLFELSTGKKMTFRNFYDGTEESFKEIIAQKVKEDFLSYPKGWDPYGAENENEVYREAYDKADLDSNVFVFGEDKITYFYTPFIKLIFTYRELLGRDQL